MYNKFAVHIKTKDRQMQNFLLCCALTFSDSYVEEHLFNNKKYLHNVVSTFEEKQKLIKLNTFTNTTILDHLIIINKYDYTNDIDICCIKKATHVSTKKFNYDIVNEYDIISSIKAERNNSAQIILNRDTIGFIQNYVYDCNKLHFVINLLYKMYYYSFKITQKNNISPRNLLCLKNKKPLIRMNTFYFDLTIIDVNIYNFYCNILRKEIKEIDNIDESYENKTFNDDDIKKLETIELTLKKYQKWFIYFSSKKKQHNDEIDEIIRDIQSRTEALMQIITNEKN